MNNWNDDKHFKVISSHNIILVHEAIQITVEKDDAREKIYNQWNLVYISKLACQIKLKIRKD